MTTNKLYKIYHSNSLQEFIKSYSSVFHTRDLFGEKVITIVQNSNIASWLRLQLAKQDGISMDLNVEFPENAVKNLAFGYKSGLELFGPEDDKKNLLFMDSLKVVLYKTLEEQLETPKNFPHLYDYVDRSPKRLFQLSDSLAGLFYHYGMNCPQMVAAWDIFEFYKGENGIVERQKDQEWQIKLWNEVFNTSTPYLHISRVLNHIIGSGEHYNPELSPYGKCKIVLFGSSFLGESAIKFFNFLSRDLEIHHFILTPSEIYGGDVVYEPKSLLKQFSGLIHGFTNISREPDFIKERESKFVEHGIDTLLHRVQKGIKDNNFDNISAESDNSLTICKVTGGWREIEILKDKILHLLDCDRSLKLTDIGVVAPDITSYSSYIEGIFPDSKIDEDGNRIYGEQDLPYNIVGLKGGDDSPYIRGILALLDLPGSSFNRKEILTILSNPCFMEKFGLTNGIYQLFIETIDKLNVKWAVDGEHRNSLGYNNDGFNTWEEGFRRFLLGITLNMEDSSDLPFNLNDSQSIDNLGTLVHIVRSLYSDFYSLNKLKLNMDEWVFLIETLAETYLLPVKGDVFDEKERLSVKHQYRNLLNLFDDLKGLSNFKKTELPYTVFYSLLKEFIIKSGNSRGRYLTQGITFSSLKPLRAVPFKHIFVLGLNEDQFPGKENIPSYDLRSIYHQKIDLSKRQNDKFAFLELLISAKESLTIFYSYKNQVSGEVLQPSVVINELLEVIENSQSIIEEHPLHNFDELYFSKNSKFISYNYNAYEACRVYYSPKKDRSLLNLDDSCKEFDKLNIDVKDLINFLKNPVKTFFTKGEGIFLENINNIEEDIYENREIGFLPKWKFANIALEYGLQTEIDLLQLVDSFFYTAQVEGVFKETNLTGNQRDDIIDIVNNIEFFLQNNNFKNSSFSRFNRELGSEFPHLEFTINNTQIVLTGELENIWTDNGGHCFLTRILSSSSKKFSLTHLFEPLIYSLIIFSHRDMMEKELVLYGVGGLDIEPIKFKDKGNSLELLTGIIDVYLKNLKKPIPLFPDLSDIEDPLEVKDKWVDISRDENSFSPIRSCPYVQFSYGDEAPDFNIDELREFQLKVYETIKEFAGE
ncbi:MAG: exodeoxyribonuclease V subunit gamma [Spirochaetales bacterium]|nr:exodeoxyribonuclease V subunit gamma [Spirochaetales bacterium]